MRLCLGLVDFPLLRSCKQINLEAKDIVYKYNTWAIPIIGDLSWRYLDEVLGHRVRHVWLKANFLSRNGLDHTGKSLELLSRLSEQAGNLQTVTLNVVVGIDEMMTLIDLKFYGEPLKSATGRFNPCAGEMLLDEYLTVLRNSRGKYDGQWAGVKRKLELLVEELRDEDNSNPGKMVEEMHDAFTGELWIDNRLCYSDRREVFRPFNWEGMWQIAWFNNRSPFWMR
jgi:hypothetical protein